MLGLRCPADNDGPDADCFSLSALEGYYEHVRALAVEFPDHWGLICRAEDRCRSEHLERQRRKLTVDRGSFTTFTEQRPWDALFRAAVEDSRFWDREVRHPAIHVVALTTRGAGHTRAADQAAGAVADLAAGPGAGR